MPMPVENSNFTNQPAPESLEQLIEFVEFVKSKSSEMFVQLSGNSVEVIRDLANHFKVNFFDTTDMKVDMNPFTILYITEDREILPRALTFKSKIVIYARRPIYNNH